MKWYHFFLLQCLLIAIIAGVIYIHKDRVILVKKPPPSLAKWYKPENKRQVFLHNMFKLRREMQAAYFYSDSNDAKHLEKWAAELVNHYKKIAGMVPEWKEKLDMGAVSSLQESVKAGRYQAVSHALDDLKRSCRSCHADYRVVTAAMYRAPDFTSIEIDSSTSFKAHMKKLTKEVNQIKIASDDGMKDVALSSLAHLKKGMDMLGGTCVTCHKKDGKGYPDETINKTIESLEESLKSGTLKEQGRYLGTLAVLACARCHGTHRFAYETRKIFSDEQDWFELMKH